MAQQPAIHSTFVIEKSYPKSPEKVFAAFSDPEKKRRWYGESRGHDIGDYALDFRVGGNEVLAVTMKAGTPIAGATLRWAQTYDDISENHRIVFSQTLDINGKRISVALVTVEFRATKTGCDLVFTHQAAFFEGADGPQMREAGWKALLGNLDREMAG
ncbi:MAG TPA: SRPBCC family protein [Hyphomonadaceae bacterium]|nr:SRPBCC family protein [Hyphomonadaceae bacterium]